MYSFFGDKLKKVEAHCRPFSEKKAARVFRVASPVFTFSVYIILLRFNYIKEPVLTKTCYTLQEFGKKRLIA